MCVIAEQIPHQQKLYVMIFAPMVLSDSCPEMFVLPKAANSRGVEMRISAFTGETDFLPLLVPTRQRRSTGKNQYW